MEHLIKKVSRRQTASIENVLLWKAMECYNVLICLIGSKISIHLSYHQQSLCVSPANGV